MAARTSFVVQGFDHVDGHLVATVRNVAQNESHALQQAEAIARRLPGAAAIRYVVQDGGPEMATILGAFGDVPDALADGLAGG